MYPYSVSIKIDFTVITDLTQLFFFLSFVFNFVKDGREHEYKCNKLSMRIQKLSLRLNVVIFFCHPISSSQNKTFLPHFEIKIT